MPRYRVSSDRRVRTGVVIGLAMAALVIAAVDDRGPAPAWGDALPPHGALLSDCDGAIRELVIQYTTEAAGIVETAYRQFLGGLPADVTVYVICSNRAAFDDLGRRIGEVPCRLVAVETGHAITCWSRDRWLALSPLEADGPTTLVAPRKEAGAEIWPQRRGDQRVAHAIAGALPERVVAFVSRLGFDGGDFVSDGERVFVTPSVARRNLGRAAELSAILRELIEKMSSRPVVLLEEAPDYHAGMFMMPIGGGTVLVGDPAAAERLIARDPRADGCPIDDPDFSAGTQRLFDAVAAQCMRAGCRVIRVPVVPGRDARTYLSYVNVIIDQRDGRRTVYMPVYEGADRLNGAAEAIWQQLGYRVRRIDCTATYRHYGSIRCLVNVLSRGE